MGNILLKTICAALCVGAVLACEVPEFLPGAPKQDDGKNEELAAMLLLAFVAGGGLSSSSDSGSGTNLNCTSTTAPGSPAFVADTVNSAPGETGSGFGDSSRAVNGICGGGTNAGSYDVFTLSQTGTGAALILEWVGKKITNGTGTDFVVFENAFRPLGSSSSVFMEAVIVEVSQDATNWCGFAPDYTNTPETSYSTSPAHWSGFAGITPVLYNRDSNPLSGAAVFDQSQAGGDGFDLDNLSDDNSYGTGCSTTLRNDIRDTNGFVYVRMTAATNRTNADTGAAFLKDSGAFSGPDIDGVVGRYLANR